MITQLKSYQADAEILGAIRNVEVSEGFLTISGITGLEEAGRILDVLANGGIKGVVHAHGAKLPGGSPPSKEPADVGDGNPTPGKAPVSPSGSPSPGGPRPAEPEKAAGVEVPENIAKAGKLSEVVVWVMERGVKEYKAVLAELKRLAPSVPVVQRVSDLEARLKRTMEKLAAEDD